MQTTKAPSPEKFGPLSFAAISGLSETLHPFAKGKLAHGLWSLLLDGHCRIAYRGVSDDDSRFLVVKGNSAHEREIVQLTEHERVIIHSAVTGSPLKVIAADLQLSTSTVHHRLRRALTKLGCVSRVELIIFTRLCRVDPTVPKSYAATPLLAAMKLCGHRR